MNSVKFKEKRAHRRLEIRLPLEYHRLSVGRCNVFRTVTINVSTGGVYFETAVDDLRVGDKLAIELGIPPDDARFPPQGKISTEGEVVRTTVIEDKSTKNGASFSRYGIGSQFKRDFIINF